MLGPVRFDHMRNCASEAIRKWIQENEARAKRLKGEMDEKEKDRLVQILHARDESITVLRGLLAEKTQAASSQDSGKSSTPKTPDYSSFPLATLEKLEQVRDKTIGWVLNQIQKAEEAQHKVPEPTGPTTETPSASVKAGDDMTVAKQRKAQSPDGKETNSQSESSEAG